jgi:hypothetical protein
VVVAPFCATATQDNAFEISGKAGKTSRRRMEPHFPRKSVPAQAKRSMGEGWRSIFRFVPGWHSGSKPSLLRRFSAESGSFRLFRGENDLHSHRKAID